MKAQSGIISMTTGVVTLVVVGSLIGLQLGTTDVSAAASGCVAKVYKSSSSKKTCVKYIQQMFNGVNYEVWADSADPKPLPAHSKYVYGVSNLSTNGLYNTKTVAAIKKFQAGNGLTKDGITGPKTWKKLCSEVKIRYSLTKEASTYDHVWPDSKAGYAAGEAAGCRSIISSY